MKTNVLSCHICLINTVVKKWTTFKYRFEIWPPDVEVNVGIQTIDKVFLQWQMWQYKASSYNGHRPSVN